MKNKLNYIIWASGYKEYSGGIVVMHKLCDLLNKAGENAYMLALGRYRRVKSVKNSNIRHKNYDTNPMYETPLLPHNFNLQDKNNVIIYSDSEAGNPVGLNNVVRWIAWYDRGSPRTSSTWKDSDLKVLYSKLFKVDVDGAPINFPVEKEIFSIFETQVNFFRDLGQKRNGNCFTIRKGADNRKRILNSSEAARYTDPKDVEIHTGPKLTKQYMLETFNKYKRFYSYDCETYLSTIAALCGCESVIVPDPTKSKQSVAAQEYVKHGVAYGLEDLDRANETRIKLRLDLEELEKQNITNVEKFVKITYDRFMIN
jgi:hypothetical protein